jgi:hypothetical protein
MLVCLEATKLTASWLFLALPPPAVIAAAAQLKNCNIILLSVYSLFIAHTDPYLIFGTNQLIRAVLLCHFERN